MNDQEERHVFISYVRENQEQVDRLCQDLESHGVSIWLDRNSIKPGARWKDAILLRDRDYTRLVTNSLDTTVAVSANTYDRIIITSEAVEDYANKVGVFRFDQQFELDYEPKGVSNHYPVFAAFSVGNDTN